MTVKFLTVAVVPALTMNTRSVLLPLMRQTGRSRTINGHVLAEGQRTREQGDRLTSKRVGEVDRAADAYAAQRLAQRTCAAIGSVGHRDIARAVQADLVQHHRFVRAIGDGKAQGLDVGCIKHVSICVLESGEGNADFLPACEIFTERSCEGHRCWLGLVETDIVDRHGLREGGFRSHRAAKVAADRDVHQDEEWMVEDPLLALQEWHRSGWR